MLFCLHIAYAAYRQFKDRTALSCLFHLHTMLCSVSYTGTLPADLQDVQNLIVDILNTYTQPSLQSEQTGDGEQYSLCVFMLSVPHACAIL